MFLLDSQFGQLFAIITFFTDVEDNYTIKIDEMKDLESNELACVHFKTENISIQPPESVHIQSLKMSFTSFQIRNTYIL